jgi:hypothetical protein
MLNGFKQLLKAQSHAHTEYRLSLAPHLRQRPLHLLVQQIRKESHAQRRLCWQSVAYARATHFAEAPNRMRIAAGIRLQEVRACGDLEAWLGQINDLVEWCGVGAAAGITMAEKRAYGACAQLNILIQCK